LQYLREAALDVQRNISAFILYAAIFSGAHILLTLVSAPFEPAVDETVPSTFLILDIVLFLVFVHVIALAQTIAFSRLGREIDRPLWKIRTDGEALTRFFMMWALINLTANGLLKLADSDFGGGDAAAINILLLFAGTGAIVVSIPVGACIMFTGRVSSRAIGESLAPIIRQPARTGIVFLIMIAQVLTVFLFLSLLVREDGQLPSMFVRLGIGLASGIVQVYLECLAVAATWHLCMVDRETVDDIDFDF
jgi:hypothetical protein